MAVDVSGVGSCPNIDASMSTEEMMAKQQEIAQWQMMVTMLTNAMDSEKEGNMAIARNL